jgi:hypothetical protein
MTDSRDPLAVQQQAERISQEMRDLARANPGMSHRDAYNLLTVLFKDEVGRTPDKTRGERPLRADPQRGRLDAQEGSQAHPCPGLAAAQRTETAFVRRFRATAGRYDSEHPQGRLTQGCCNPGTRPNSGTNGRIGKGHLTSKSEPKMPIASCVRWQRDDRTSELSRKRGGLTKPTSLTFCYSLRPPRGAVGGHLKK